MSEEIYDKIGFNYAKYRKADVRIIQAIIDHLDLVENGKIADIGAGTGNYSQAIAEYGFQVKCIEPSDVMLKQKNASRYSMD